ncbi:hypothetical protein RJ55_06424 [Drechmeria coniospora]|nr:hypothetical protein RJ55_06424 [Drechmeria coniospora]
MHLAYCSCFLLPLVGAQNLTEPGPRVGGQPTAQGRLAITASSEESNTVVGEHLFTIGLYSDSTVKVDKIVVETSDLEAFNLSVVSLAGCNQTRTASTQISCDLDGLPAGKTRTRSTVVVREKERPNGDLCLIPINATSYIRDAGTKQLQRWRRVRTVLNWCELTYEQADAYSRFTRPSALVVAALPSAEDEQRRLKQRSKWADFTPTGLYLNPRRRLNVTLSGFKGVGERPMLVVGTPLLINPRIKKFVMRSNLKQYELEEGDNIVSNDHGGIIYLRHTYRAGTEPPAPVTVRVNNDAAQPFPLFREGITTNEEWIDMLRSTTVPFAEYYGERVIITGLADATLDAALGGGDQQELLAMYKNIIAAQDAISGLNATAKHPADRPSPLRPMVVHGMHSGVLAASTNYCIIVGRGAVGDIWVLPELAASWKIWHELGHQRQHVTTWSWQAMTEVTTNIYALAAGRECRRIRRPKGDYEHGTVNEWIKARAYLALGGKKNFDTADVFTKLIMFEQLRVVFGHEFYPELHRRSRAAEAVATDADRKHFFMTQASDIAKENLVDYFVKWGLRPEERTKVVMGQHAKPKVDYTNRAVYVDEK